MKKYLAIYALLFGAISAFPIHAKENTPSLISNKSIPPRDVEWIDLMPAEDLKLLESMKPVDHSTLSQKELANDKPIKNNSLRQPGKNSDNSRVSKFENSGSGTESTKKSNGQAKARTWKDALVSTRVRPEFNNVKIKLAGFIVPLEYDVGQLVKNFFFVPYFGACIHVPPPPPNQIIYVRLSKGLKLHDIYTPYTVTGILHVETIEKELGVSSYSLDADSVVVYKEE